MIHGIPVFFPFCEEAPHSKAYSSRFLAFEGNYHMGKGVSWHTVPSIKRYLMRCLFCLIPFSSIQEEGRDAKKH
jgi:hypothetical protein